MRYSSKEIAAVASVLALVIGGVVAIWLDSSALATTCLTMVGLVLVALLVDNRRHERDRYQRMTRLTLDKSRESRMRFEELGAGFRTSAARVRDVDAEVRRQLSLTSKESEATRSLMRAQHRDTEHLIRHASQEIVREVAATLDLQRRVHDAPAPLPPPAGAALDASGLVRLIHLITLRRPSLVVACGSGATTVWLGHALRQVGGRVVALEQDAGTADETRQLLAEHGLEDVAEVRLAALTDVDVDGGTSCWYDVEAVQDLQDVGLLLVDGPRRAPGNRVRYPAVPVLRDRLAQGAIVALAGADREDETDLVQLWLTSWPGAELRPSESPRLAVLETPRASDPVPETAADRMPS